MFLQIIRSSLVQKNEEDIENVQAQIYRITAYSTIV